MRKLAVIIFVLSAVAAFSANSWTVMVFLNGDNNLESYAVDDFLEISGSEIDSSVASIVVQFDRISGYDTRYDNWTTAKIFNVHSKSMAPSSSNASSDLGEVNMGSPEVLSDFIINSIVSFPADRYALVLWDHGNSWYRSMKALDISIDDTNGYDSISVGGGELRNALASAFEVTEKVLDIMLIDACLSQTLTLSGEVQGYVSYVLASEDFVPGEGLDYTEFLNHIFSSSGAIGAESLGTAAVTDYWTDYMLGPDNTFSLLNLSYFTPFMTEFETLTQQFIAMSSYGYRKFVIETLESFVFDGYEKNADLGGFLEEVSTGGDYTGTTAELAGAALEAYGNMVVSASGHLKDYYASGGDATGVTIYFGNDTSYSASRLSTLYSWDDFLFSEAEKNPYAFFPNPSGEEYVYLGGLLNGDILSIYTIDGELLYFNDRITDLVEKIDIKDYPSGVYVALIVSPENGIVHRKFAKVR